jgi:hypothetical protein
MTNLLYALNDDALESITVTASSTATGYYADNLITGGRWEHWRAGSAGTTHTIVYDFGGEVAPNTVAICRADLCVKDDDTVEFKVEHSDDDSSYTEWFDETVETDDLMGPNNEDWIYYDATQAEEHRYWRLTITYSASGLPELSKVFICAAYDIGRDPDMQSLRKVRMEETMHKPARDLHLSYKGIAYDTAMHLLDTLSQGLQELSIVAFAADYDGILVGDSVLHCQVLDISTPQHMTDYNNIELWLRELI